MRNVHYFVGLELGAANEFTALAVLERPLVTLHTPTSQRRPVYTLGHLERFPLGTSYPEIFQSVRKLLQTPPIPARETYFVVDQTGVGDAVIRMLEETMGGQVTCSYSKVTVTLGQATCHQDGVGLCIPKKELVSVAQVLLQTRRLKVPKTLVHAQLLVKELEGFKMKVPLVRPDQLTEMWREGPNDDLVFAVALAAWGGERALPGLYERPEPRFRQVAKW
jgi:hypothetical protein